MSWWGLTWDDDDRPERADEYLEATALGPSRYESLCAAFDDAMSRDEVADGFHAFGPYVVEVVAGVVVDMNTIVLPSRVGWEPVF